MKTGLKMGKNGIFEDGQKRPNDQTTKTGKFRRVYIGSFTMA
jgi:hypothetical protein